MDKVLSYISTNATWLFEGIGTELISLAIGGIIGYVIGVNRTIKQTQKGGANSSQYQELRINSVTDSENAVSQKQDGGDDSVQTQVGEINARK